MRRVSGESKRRMVLHMVGRGSRHAVKLGVTHVQRKEVNHLLETIVGLV